MYGWGRGLTGRKSKSPSPIPDLEGLGNIPEKSQVPVRLSLPKRLMTRRSTTTARWAPCSPAMMRVADRATARPVLFTSANTFEGSPITQRRFPPAASDRR
jgi:hypothetical protein